MANNTVSKVAGSTIEIMAVADLDNLLATKINVVLDFYAGWCGPCKALGYVLGDMTTELSSYNACIARIDVDALQELASKYSVRSLPTLVFLRSSNTNEPAGLLVGAVPKSQIQQALASNFG